jgi:hypothetical protein
MRRKNKTFDCIKLVKSSKFTIITPTFCQKIGDGTRLDKSVEKKVL